MRRRDIFSVDIFFICTFTFFHFFTSVLYELSLFFQAEDGIRDKAT